MTRPILLVLATLTFLLPASAALAQTAIQAHYADGQIWVVWDFAMPPPQTFVIYSSDAPIAQLSDGEQVGRLFGYEYISGALREQFGPLTRGWVIPAAGGAGVDTLGAQQALFVETVHAPGPRYFAVVAHGDTTVTPGVNATTVPADPVYSPDEPVECHLQIEGQLPGGFTSQAYAMWADGREDPEDRRPDFPVCANAAKNGMPSIFVVSYRDDIPPGPRPVTYWLHGGGGRASQSMPGDRPFYNIDPDEGLLVAHNDDLVRWIGGAVWKEASNSWWFGWGIHHDPFPDGPDLPPAGEIIVNYTQRRLVWIHDWLVRQGRADPDRTSVQGHSMGSAGTTALGKAYPDRIATCTIFNNGFTGPDTCEDCWNIFGLPEDGLKTNFVDAAGDSIPLYEVYDLTTYLAPGKDLPLFRSFHGKNDTVDPMNWDAGVVEQYRMADSLGMGMHLYWDERRHSPQSGPPGHWAAGTTPDLQTERDNAAYQEPHSVSQSFPAFHDHRLVPGGFDPGDGDPANGDPWGTWGGYHDWELDTVVDEPERWGATVFLINGSIWLPDNCPVDSMPSSLTIRRAQAFAPPPGETVDWAQLSLAGDTLRAGSVVADTEGRVHLADFMTYRDPLRTRVQFQRRPVGVPGNSPPAILSLAAAPNPFNPKTEIRFTLAHAGVARLTIHDVGGRLVRTLAARPFSAGVHEFSWDGRGEGGDPVASGVYLARVAAAGQTRGLRLVLIK